MSKKQFTVEAVFPYTDGFWKIEQKIDGAVGKRSDGSGSGFGERDLCYYFDNAEKALTAYKKLLRLRDITRLNLVMSVE